MIDDARATCPNSKSRTSNYSSGDASISPRVIFFDVDDIQIKAWDGGPFYSYFFGLFVTQAQYVMHLDGDMLFGGGSKSWIKGRDRVHAGPA